MTRNTKLHIKLDTCIMQTNAASGYGWVLSYAETHGVCVLYELILKHELRYKSNR